MVDDRLFGVFESLDQPPEYPGVHAVLRELALGTLPSRFIVDAMLLKASFEHALKHGVPELSFSCDAVPTAVYAILTGDGDIVPAFWVPTEG